MPSGGIPRPAKRQAAISVMVTSIAAFVFLAYIGAAHRDTNAKE
jgi:hypothetical protein